MLQTSFDAITPRQRATNIELHPTSSIKQKTFQGHRYQTPLYESVMGKPRQHEPRSTNGGILVIKTQSWENEFSNKILYRRNLWLTYYEDHIQKRKPHLFKIFCCFNLHEEVLRHKWKELIMCQKIISLMNPPSINLWWISLVFTWWIHIQVFKESTFMARLYLVCVWMDKNTQYVWARQHTSNQSWIDGVQNLLRKVWKATTCLL